LTGVSRSTNKRLSAGRCSARILGVLTDFILSWGREGSGPTAVRIPGAHLMPLSNLYPGASAREAYAMLLADVLSRTNADAVPDRVVIEAGKYPRYASIAALNAAFYSARQT